MSSAWGVLGLCVFSVGVMGGEGTWVCSVLGVLAAQIPSFFGLLLGSSRLTHGGSLRPWAHPRCCVFASHSHMVKTVADFGSRQGHQKIEKQIVPCVIGCTQTSRIVSIDQIGEKHRSITKKHLLNQRWCFFPMPALEKGAALERRHPALFDSTGCEHQGSVHKQRSRSWTVVLGMFRLCSGKSHASRKINMFSMRFSVFTEEVI